MNKDTQMQPADLLKEIRAKPERRVCKGGHTSLGEESHTLKRVGVSKKHEVVSTAKQ